MVCLHLLSLLTTISSTTLTSVLLLTELQPQGYLLDEFEERTHCVWHHRGHLVWEKRQQEVPFSARLHQSVQGKNGERGVASMENNEELAGRTCLLRLVGNSSSSSYSSFLLCFSLHPPSLLCHSLGLCNKSSAIRKRPPYHTERKEATARLVSLIIVQGTVIQLLTSHLWVGPHGSD